MGKRAEAAALKAYPNDGRKVFHSSFGTFDIDHNAPYRKGYAQGYEQAEKDLALTKEDVRTIFNLVRELQVKYSSTEGCLQEVADIFNEQRKK